MIYRNLFSTGYVIDSLIYAFITYLWRKVDGKIQFSLIFWPTIFSKFMLQSTSIALGSNLVPQFCRLRCITVFPIRSNNKNVCYFKGRGILWLTTLWRSKKSPKKLQNMKIDPSVILWPCMDIKAEAWPKINLRKLNSLARMKGD